MTALSTSTRVAACHRFPSNRHSGLSPKPTETNARDPSMREVTASAQQASGESFVCGGGNGQDFLPWTAAGMVLAQTGETLARQH